MGVACILNAQRCRRTHCRYTGPYFLCPFVSLVLPALLEDSLNGSRWVFSLRSVADCCGGQQNAHGQVPIRMRVHPTRLAPDVFPENHVSNVRKGLVSRASPVHTATRNCMRDEGGPWSSAIRS